MSEYIDGEASVELATDDSSCEETEDNEIGDESMEMEELLSGDIPESSPTFYARIENERSRMGDDQSENAEDSATGTPSSAAIPTGTSAGIGSQRPDPLRTNRGHGPNIRPSNPQRGGRPEPPPHPLNGAAARTGRAGGDPQMPRLRSPVQRDEPGPRPMQRVPEVPNGPNGGRFRMNGKNFWLTWPQVRQQLSEDCINWTDDELMSQFRDELISKGATSGCLSAEPHSDGHTHFHAFCRFDRKKDVRSNRFFDCYGVHGSYRITTNPAATIDYCNKHGKFIFWGVEKIEDLSGDSRVVKRNREWEDIGALVLEGKSAKDIVMQKPSRFRELRKIEDAVNAQSVWNTTPKKTFMYAAATAPEDPASSASYNATIVEWLNKNIGKVRSFRQKQLYVYGPPHSAKTTGIVHQLEQCCRIYHAPYDAEWFDTYDDDSYDLIVFDDYKSQYKIQLLNQILDGSTKPMPRRGRAPFLKKKNLPCIFISNWTLEQNYSMADADRLAPLLDRLQIVEVKPFVKIHIYCQ